MRAVWLTAPAVTPIVSGQNAERNLLACPMASARLRMGVAANTWREQGNENLFLGPSALHGTEVMDSRGADICVIPKFTIDLPLAPWVDACRAFKNNGSRLVVDICDNPLRKTPDVVDEFYAWVLGIADAVVVNSARMAEQIAPHFAKPVVVIADAVLEPRAAPAFSPAKRLKLLWFGHPSNLRFLEPWISELIASAPRPCRLVIVTQDGYGVREAARNIQARYAPAFEARFVVWSLESTRRELAACDLAILPGAPSDSVKGGVSANRIAEILNAGRFPVASPLQSYLEFEDAAWLGNHVIEGIRWAQAHPEEVLSRIRRGQALVAEKYTMHRLGGQWCELLRKLGTAS